MRIEYFYRYPVKGLTAEALEEAPLTPYGAIPWDRAFALAQGDARFDPDHPAWLPKSNFMCLMKNATIARIKTSFDPDRGALALAVRNGPHLTADAFSPSGRARIEAFLTDFLGPEARAGVPTNESAGRPATPRFHYVSGHTFMDHRKPVVSFINLASLEDLERRVGEGRERLRFRANVYFRDASPWGELCWIGRNLAVGAARLRIVKSISRCPATEVNLVTGIRDAHPVQELRANYGHQLLGFYAEVTDGGRIALGDSIALMPE